MGNNIPVIAIIFLRLGPYAWPTACPTWGTGIWEMTERLFHSYHPMKEELLHVLSNGVIAHREQCGTYHDVGRQFWLPALVVGVRQRAATER